MRQRIVFLILILLLAACGSPAAPASDSPATSAATSTASTGATRTIRHALGETAVPATPQRVIVLDTGALANALALGVKPVGAVLGSSSFVRYLGDQIDGIEDLTSDSGEPNLERALALKPDLIIGTRANDEPNYATLSRIGPTVLAAAHPSQEWKAYVTFVGEALGKAQQAEQLLKQYDARIAEFKSKMGDRLATSVSIVRSRPENTQVYLKKTFAGALIEEAGLRRPPSQDRAPENFADNFEDVSLELIPQLDADIIFWMRRDEQEGAGMQQAMAHPLWARLSAVQQRRVYEVPLDVWVAGWNITGANLLLDDLFKYLAEEQR